MLSFPLVVIFLITIIFLFWLNSNGTGFKKIPGPWGLPLFGNVFQVGDRMHLKFAEWARHYGDIFQVRLGSKLSIVISDPKMIKDVFTNDAAFTGRQFFDGFEIYPNEKLGIVVSQGQLWELHRRFLLRQLRDFGFGKSSMEQLITSEVQETINKFKQLSKDNKPITSTKDIFLIAVFNSLWTVVAGKRYAHDDPKLQKMMADANHITEELMKRMIFFLVPWTRIFLPKLDTYEEFRDSNRQFYIDTVDEHKKTYEEGNMRDFVDVYLAEMEKSKDNPNSLFYGKQAEKNLHAILRDLHDAGSDTTSTTLAWAVLYLCKNKRVQEKLQAEITSITGDLRTVTLDDRSKMPYAVATLDETMRMSSIVPNGVQHSATEGKEFNGYFIPKDTWIFPNLYYLHYNPKVWGDPEIFRPERFISSEGLYKKSENLLPFQVGKRVCVGETLARDTMFLFLTNIFQKFDISLDPNVEEPSLEPKVNFVLFPQEFSIIVKERNNLW